MNSNRREVEQFWIVEARTGIVHRRFSGTLMCTARDPQMFNYNTLDAMRPVLRACEGCMKEGLPNG